MRKGKKIMMYILVFVLAFGLGVASKVVIAPSWSKKYSVKWNDDLGTRYVDLSYGNEEAQRFDLYLPSSQQEHYGLVVYLHAGGFTSGDKSDDADMLSWLCSKGYVAAWINYTLRTETNNTSVLSQSNEIKMAIPEVIAQAKGYGYDIDEMAIAGGSARHCLAMIYAYRDGENAPVPLKLTFGAVGPASFYVEDWGILGLGNDTDESKQAGATLFSVMSGEVITPEMIDDGTYLEKVKPISAADWVTDGSVPCVVAYGTHDKVQPYAASLRLLEALEDHHIDHQYFELPHSGHGLQNDHAIYQKYMEAVEAYLEQYL